MSEYVNTFSSSKIGYFKPTSDFTGSETAANPNPDNRSTVTLSACWVKQDAYTYDYTGGEQTFTAPCNGYYKLEVWGAQGGSGYSVPGAYGSYSIGATRIDKNTMIYINVGGVGAACASSICKGGYNGGGNATASRSQAGGGGGATHISTISGELKNLSAQKGSLVNNSYYNSSKILIVAGGGGGSSSYGGSSSCQKGYGGVGGGIRGGKIVNGNLCNTDRVEYLAATQISGGEKMSNLSYSSDVDGIFGKGGLGASSDCPSCGGNGGGGGFFGGAGSGRDHIGGGGGSGYIGSSNLISTSTITKHMTCYSCTTSTADATRTNSNTATPSATATADVAKLNNGYARITYLGATI